MENSFTTYDTLLCSFLLTHQDVSLIEVKEMASRQFIFVLSQPSLCERLSRDYLNNAQAPARELFSKRAMLISEIKNRNRNEERYGKQ